MTLHTTARRSNRHLLLAAATALLALSACGRGDTDDDTVVVSNTVHTPFDSDTVDLPFPQLSPPECTDPIAVAAGNEGLGFDPVNDDGVTPPPEGSYDHMPEGEWEWICGRG